MKYCVLLSLLALGCMHIHGAPTGGHELEQGSCDDAFVLSAAKEALTKINQDRKEGYIFSLYRLSNAHIGKHGESGVVFYLTLNVVETNCSVLSRKDWKTCEARPPHDTPVYGQCKATIYINKPHRVVRLLKYNCNIRPVPATKLHEMCPDCPSLTDTDNTEIEKALSVSLEKFNKESGLVNRFAVLNITRALAGMAMGMYYNVEYTIQETTCARGTEAVTADKCPIMDCEFAHKGFCKGYLSYTPTGDTETSVKCEIYEPEAAIREKVHHLLGGETDHSHNDTHTHDHDHDHTHSADASHKHDHVHDHTKSHAQHEQNATLDENSDHHHSHDHDAGSAHRHAHDHSHEHGHGHDHVHAHHAKAHDHSGDFPNQHHDYKHADGEHTHEHDHELALDHDHKHAHLHEHEHHHHHHKHDHENEFHDHPEGMIKMWPAIDMPMILPFFPKVTEVAVTLPILPDPQIPGETQPVILPFPTNVAEQCVPPVVELTLLEKLFAEDPLFKPDA